MTSQRTRERLVQRLIDQGIQQIDVLEAIRTTPRHIFVDEALAHRAYEDVSLTIGFNQTISQPYIVAKMTELVLREGGVGKVLEVGTGCGYQTAILAQLVDQIYSIERIKPLLDRARTRLRTLGLRNVSLKHGDGSWGWPEQGPFDAILTTAAPHEVPKELIGQLVEGGVLVIPVGPSEQQELRVYRKTADAYSTEIIEEVRFVPLLSGLVDGRA